MTLYPRGLTPFAQHKQPSIITSGEGGMDRHLALCRGGTGLKQKDADSKLNPRGPPSTV